MVMMRNNDNKHNNIDNNHMGNKMITKVVA